MRVARGSLTLLAVLLVSGCLSTIDPVATVPEAAVTVKMDFYHRPLPEIPLPNDIATRYDARSATGRRINASLVAPTGLEEEVRTLIDELDGWGVLQPITIPFTGEIDLNTILAGHRDPDYAMENDVVYLMNITRGSPEYGELVTLDVGNGNYPVILEQIDGYWEHDPRGWTVSISFDEADEDLNRNGRLDPPEDLNGNGFLDEGEDLNENGVLDPGEDSDDDGVLDVPNYLPCGAPGVEGLPCDETLGIVAPPREDIAARADALMTFYERETNTLILRPMEPLSERSQYAVLVTRRILDVEGNPVGSPFPAIHHISQSEPLSELPELLPDWLGIDEIAFAFTFTTQSLSSGWVALRDGLYGHGIQRHLSQEFPAQLATIEPVRDPARSAGGQNPDNPYVVYTEVWLPAFKLIANSDLLGLGTNSKATEALIDSHESNIDYHVVGSFRSAQLFRRTLKEGSVIDCASLCAKGAAEPTGCESASECTTRCAGWPIGTRECFDRVGLCAGETACLLAPEGGEEAAGDEETPAEEAEVEEDLEVDGIPRLINPCSPPMRCVESRELINWQNYNLQSWPEDLGTEKVEASVEDVHFWLMMPRKEHRPPGPVPIAFIGHGYGSSRFESLAFGGFFARKGFAILAIDCPSHGLEASPSEGEFIRSVSQNFGVASMIEAAFRDRSYDQDFDQTPDSGADFWTAYIFHTRDVVRQCVFDMMQMIRVVRSFDGERRWNFDVNGDGENELAGDFDADGEVDIGPDSPIFASGGSLGGITATLLGSLEPAVRVTIPISGGGGLGDVGVRSTQGGVREAVILRVMGPIFVGEPGSLGQTEVSVVAPHLKKTRKSLLGAMNGLNPGDTVYLQNLRTGDAQCSTLSAEGTFRIHLESDYADPIAFAAYQGPQHEIVDERCELREGAQSKARLDRFQQPIRWLGREWPVGAPLVSVAEGFGERRASPGLRRFLSLGQLVLDAGDPATYARHLLKHPLRYPGTGEETGAHAMIVTTMGDMKVPASAGLTVGRAAGIVEYRAPHPAYGVPENQVIIDSYVAESVNGIGRYRDSSGAPVHIDIEGFGDGLDLWEETGVPRLPTPLRSGFEREDARGGVSGAIFPYTIPEGQHGFNFPGGDQDLFIRRCRDACPAGDEACLTACDESYTGRYDVGWFLFNFLGDYAASGGKTLNLNACIEAAECD
ncbi:MAG: hypothetical protein VYD19_05415 [Myxococcota bacterium]|nr:hypothetical protein [Myxococcota bacterium]